MAARPTRPAAGAHDPPARAPTSAGIHRAFWTTADRALRWRRSRGLKTRRTRPGWPRPARARPVPTRTAET